MTNSGTLVAVAVATAFPSAWVLDPVAAICLALWMIYIWQDQAKGRLIISRYVVALLTVFLAEQILLIAGQAATPHEISEITFLALTHDPRVVAVDTVLAYSIGSRLQVSSYPNLRCKCYRLDVNSTAQVEVDIVMPPTMLLTEAHDIGEALQVGF